MKNFLVSSVSAAIYSAGYWFATHNSDGTCLVYIITQLIEYNYLHIMDELE